MRILLKQISRGNSQLNDFASDFVPLTIHIYPVLNKPKFLLQETLTDKYIGYDVNSKKTVAYIVQKEIIGLKFDSFVIN